MRQLPIFVNLAGREVRLIGEGEPAQAKRRLIERAGGQASPDADARLAFVAIADEDDAAAIAAPLRATALVNVVDTPDLCDFTTPAVIDRDPVLIAVGTGGASAGLAKALRQRIEALLPASLGALAEAIAEARDAIVARWPDAADRRRAIDGALLPGGALDPLVEQDAGAVARWLAAPAAPAATGLVELIITSADPDELTLRAARLLGQADLICHAPGIAPALLDRARADAERQEGAPPDPLPPGLTLWLRTP